MVQGCSEQPEALPAEKHSPYGRRVRQDEGGRELGCRAVLELHESCARDADDPYRRSLAIAANESPLLLGKRAAEEVVAFDHVIPSPHELRLVQSS